ncbi:hypothetical protein K503DRAFT_769799 [Rhizopogon vinicolor AM-OR11-026]|uniref:Uncharacterized protein n=1 Tax=Rhizopogon vinicolor AM-OR11-026 TaxID=1314800 RepID=A0A1B7N2P4_9AGAM|nr:hypothetical protein K503DRAFT_769799 [Rhizopogon vinicolor AM-OR11-026]
MSLPIFPYRVSSYISLASLQEQWRHYVHYAETSFVLLDFDSFTDSLVGGTPMPNSPIAVIAWGVNCTQICVYYIMKDSTLQELYWTLDNASFVAG